MDDIPITVIFPNCDEAEPLIVFAQVLPQVGDSVEYARNTFGEVTRIYHALIERDGTKSLSPAVVIKAAE